VKEETAKSRANEMKNFIFESQRRQGSYLARIWWTYAALQQSCGLF